MTVKRFQVTLLMDKLKTDVNSDRTKTSVRLAEKFYAKNGCLLILGGSTKL